MVLRVCCLNRETIPLVNFQIVKVDIEDSLTVGDGHGSLIIECIICELGQSSTHPGFEF